MAEPTTLADVPVFSHDIEAAQIEVCSPVVFDGLSMVESEASHLDAAPALSLSLKSQPSTSQPSTLSPQPPEPHTSVSALSTNRDSAETTDHFDEPYLVAPAPSLGPLPPSVALPESSWAFLLPRQNPVNRQGWRYVPCAPSPSSGPLGPLGQAFQRLVESVPQEIRFSWEDRSQYVYLTEDARTITTDKGFRAARTNVGVREGAWYWEVKVDRGGGEGGRHAADRADKGEGEGSWVRLGVGRREAPLNAPVGYDGYSYAYRDRHGDAVTLSRPTAYGSPAFSSTTIGVYLSLPPRPPPSPTDRRDPARIHRKRIPISFKGQLYFESVEFPASPEMQALAVDPATKAKQEADAAAKLDKAKKAAAAPGSRPAPPPAEKAPERALPVLEGSKLAFFVDGVCQGVAFEDVYDFLPLRALPGERKKDVRRNWHDDGDLAYFPMVSVFGGAVATLNSGPDFEFPPPDDIEAALWESKRPPTGERMQADGREGAGRRWRPLSDRYAEYLAEQNHLDNIDEAEAIRQEHLRLAALACAPPRPPSAAPTHLAPNKRSKLSNSIKPALETPSITPASASAVTSRASSVELGLPPLPGLAGLTPPPPPAPPPLQPAIEPRTESALNSPVSVAREVGAGEMEAAEGLLPLSAEGAADQNAGSGLVGEAELRKEASVGVADSEAGGGVDAAGELEFLMENEAPVISSEGGMDWS